MAETKERLTGILGQFVGVVVVVVVEVGVGVGVVGTEMEVLVLEESLVLRF